MSATGVVRRLWRAGALAGVLATQLGAAAWAAAAEPDWPYTTDFGSYLLHVHPEVNYALHPEWLDAWERGRLGHGVFRGTFGSSATDELMIDAHWALNPVLAPGLRLRQDLVWQQRRHLPHDRLDLWLGLEQRVWRQASVVVQTVPAERKEEMDLRLGGLWATDDRSRYLQVMYVREDFMHDEKDNLKGVTDTAPAAVDWLARLKRGRWTLSTEGRWGRGFERRYPDAARSPELAAHARASHALTARVRRQADAGPLLEASWVQAEDAERRAYRQATFDHDYAGWYRVLSLRAVQPVAPRWRVRGELHRLDRRAHATGWRAFSYRRHEVMPAVWGEWAWSPRRTVELGYLGTFYHWRRRDAQRPESETRDGYADKVELALIHRLAGEAAIKLSLSHELSLERFGGGSLRLITGF